jgi:hypothetical protein
MQTRMASMTRDAEGWRDRVEYMRTAMHVQANVSDQDAGDHRLVSHDSCSGRTPCCRNRRWTCPVTRTRCVLSAATRRISCTWSTTCRGRTGCRSARLRRKNGYRVDSQFRDRNKITRLDPKTGEMQDFKVPNVGTAAIHSAVPAPDGSVWLAEQGRTSSGAGIPTRSKSPNIRMRFFPAKKAWAKAGTKHTVRLDPSGNAWGERAAAHEIRSRNAEIHALR